MPIIRQRLPVERDDVQRGERKDRELIQIAVLRRQAIARGR